MESGYSLFCFSEQPNRMKKTHERNNRIVLLIRGISKAISLLVFPVLLIGNANAVPPSHYSTCSYYGYYPYSHGSYDAAIACADNWVENGWRRCPSCKLTHFYSLAGHPWPYNGGHINIYVCADGMLPDSSSNECVSEVYTLVVPDDVPPAQHCVGNPISVAGGIKHQQEVDIPSNKEGGVNVARRYSASYGSHHGAWLINYNQSIDVIKPEWTRSPNPAKQIGIVDASRSHGSKENACISGWAEISSRLSATWTTNAAASLNGDICEISRDGTVVRRLPLILDRYQAPAPQVVRLFRSDGTILTYRKSGAVWEALGSWSGLLQEITGASSGWRYTTSDGTVENYDSAGKLVSMTSANRVEQQLFYDETAGLLTRVEDSSGGKLFFAYLNDRLSSVTTNDNKVTQYHYNGAEMLIAVERPEGTHRLYHYEDPRFPTYLTGITDERGVRYATWTYDDQGRAISSEHAGGTDKTLLAFNADGSTTVTNPLGKQTTYHFADIAGARRVTQVEGHATTSCEDANQSYTYTPEGWIESKTDWKGNTTTYSYNAFGQEVSRTEAFGTPQARTITTEWHPDFYVKTRVVEGGKETRYTYDDSGRLLSTTTNPLSIQ